MCKCVVLLVTVWLSLSGVNVVGHEPPAQSPITGPSHVRPEGHVRQNRPKSPSAEWEENMTCPVTTTLASPDQSPVSSNPVETVYFFIPSIELLQIHSETPATPLCDCGHVDCVRKPTATQPCHSFAGPFTVYIASRTV